LLYSADVVATLTPNGTGRIFNSFDGFDYSIAGLSLALPAGTYWLGLNTVGGRNTGWDTTTGGPDTIQGARLINVNSPAPGTTVSDFAFQVMGTPQPARMLADYNFEGTPIDCSGNSAAIELRNTTFANGTLCLNGIYEGDNPLGFHAFAVIRNFSYESFTVALDFFALDFAKDNIITGGSAYRWFSLRNNSGNLEVTLNNQNLAYPLPNSPLSLNQWHSAICSVNATAKKIITVLDGRRLQDIDLSPNFRFDVVGSPSDSIDRLFTFANYSNGSVFHGYVDNLKVWGRALLPSEVDTMLTKPSVSIQRAVLISWPKFPTGFTLRWSSNVTGPYEVYTGTVFVEGNQCSAAVPLCAPQKFFQLSKP
jgi:hypothetical protein